MHRNSGGALFIVDNSDSEWKVQKYLAEWCEIAESIDIASGYFEIGALLSLDGQWQKLKKIRILMGDEVTKRTQVAFNAALSQTAHKLDQSIEVEKEINDFLDGVPAIIQALQNRVIECKIYRKEKFHAKAYITHAKLDVVGPAALIGSSNFTLPGIIKNIELNIQIRSEVETLQKWFDKHWQEAEDVTDDMLRVITRHAREFAPFEVYVKSLYEYFRGHELTAGEWETKESKMYGVLDQYQREGYHALLKIASQYNGAFLCDSVGLGKTYIGLMLIERMLMLDHNRVVLIVPKGARKPVWEAKIKKYMPAILNGFLPFKIINHTDLTRRASADADWPAIINSIQDQGEIFIIDEAHHFRNRNTSRYDIMYDVAEKKTLFLLTATPINNSLLDLQHQIELFSRREEKYFADAPLGIHSLRGHFVKLEKELEEYFAAKGLAINASVDDSDARQVLANDDFFNALVVQRSRRYVQESQRKSGGNEVLFPDRKDPTVIDYSLKKIYGKLLNDLKNAFNRDKPLLNLAVYYPYAYYKGPDTSIDPMEEGRQKQVVGLIRTLFLKRFESSKEAFEFSCEDLLLRLLAFVHVYNKKLADRWQGQHEDVLKHIEQHRSINGAIKDEDAEEDYLPIELLEKVKALKENEFDIDKIVQETILDMDQLCVFISDLVAMKNKKDDKIEMLVKTLKENRLLKSNKVLIFSEYMVTARYIEKELKNRGFQLVEEIDGSSDKDRGDIINRFSPYYNDLTSAQLLNEGKHDIRILISTDILSEGLNLQDASLLINYDLHWNPVRLMQRIGRIDRRLDADIEKKMTEDHPDLTDSRGSVYFWNFLPPDELNELLSLYEKVTSKTLRISKTFGIEGRKLLTPEDDYAALKEFNHSYEGTITFLEKMHLEYQELIKQNTGLLDLVRSLPVKIFSGKAHTTPGAKAVFFCYRLPTTDVGPEGNKEETGITKWYLYDLSTEKIMDDPAEISDFIRCAKNTERKQTIAKDTLKQIRSKMEKHIKNSYLKKVQAPGDAKMTLLTWMELS